LTGKEKSVSLNINTFSGWPGEPEWMKDLRSRARAEMTDLPWPGRRNEEWERTDIAAFKIESRDLGALTQEVVQKSNPLPGFAGHLVLQGAQVVSVWLKPELEAQGVRLVSLREAVIGGTVTAKPDALATVLEAVFHGVEVKPPALHAVLLEAGAVLLIPGNLVVEEPFLLELEETRTNVLASPQLILWAGRSSQVTVVVRRKSSAVLDATVNSAAFTSLDDGAVVNWIDVQEYGTHVEWIDHSRAHLGRDATLFHWSACLGGNTVKTSLRVDLNGEGASLRAHGLYFGVNDQHKDLRIVQNHVSPRTSSNALYKGAVRDRARTIFQGLIEVQPQAFQTDAYLSNKNLVLTDGARADSLPQLKIDNNDVKCSHGSTTGKVNEDEVFYLMARGLSRSEARLLIAEGLFADLIAEVPEFLRPEIESHVVEALGAP
jgi:Fe-S cluster assembly protein SufD